MVIGGHRCQTANKSAKAFTLQGQWWQELARERDQGDLQSFKRPHNARNNFQVWKSYSYLSPKETQLQGNEDNFEDLKAEFPWKPSFRFPLLNGVHKKELEDAAHFLHLLRRKGRRRSRLRRRRGNRSLVVVGGEEEKRQTNECNSLNKNIRATICY